MVLAGQAKRDYQRKYMRRYRAKNKDSAILAQKPTLKNAPGLTERQKVRPADVRPKDVRPKDVRPKPQSYNSMMVGYVPPKG